jgi:hypothetical protein
MNTVMYNTVRFILGRKNDMGNVRGWGTISGHCHSPNIPFPEYNTELHSRVYTKTLEHFCY